jgi:septum formation protein
MRPNAFGCECIIGHVSLVLASRSPRRAELLSAAGFEFTVEPADVDERARPGESPDAYVCRVAREKAQLVARRRPTDVVLAADTIVVVDGLVLGKPADDADAAAMLRRLAGRAHEVLTGVAIEAQGRSRAEIDRTIVFFAVLSDEDIAWYVASGEPRDKAGAYGIQGLASRFVPRIDGSYTNVVGLPVALVTALLRRPLELG